MRFYGVRGQKIKNKNWKEGERERRERGRGGACASLKSTERLSMYIILARRTLSSLFFFSLHVCLLSETQSELRMIQNPPNFFLSLCSSKKPWFLLIRHKCDRAIQGCALTSGSSEFKDPPF